MQGLARFRGSPYSARAGSGSCPGALDTTLDIVMYDIDLFEASQASINALEAQGRIVSVGLKNALELVVDLEKIRRPAEPGCLEASGDLLQLDDRGLLDPDQDLGSGRLAPDLSPIIAPPRRSTRASARDR